MRRTLAAILGVALALCVVQWAANWPVVTLLGPCGSLDRPEAVKTESQLSFLPPGTRCTFYFEKHDPQPERVTYVPYFEWAVDTGMVLVLGLAAAGTWRLVRKLRRRRNPDGAPSLR